MSAIQESVLEWVRNSGVCIRGVSTIQGSVLEGCPQFRSLDKRGVRNSGVWIRGPGVHNSGAWIRGVSAIQGSVLEGVRNSGVWIRGGPQFRGLD